MTENDELFHPLHLDQDSVCSYSRSTHIYRLLKSLVPCFLARENENENVERLSCWDPYKKKKKKVTGVSQLSDHLQ